VALALYGAVLRLVVLVIARIKLGLAVVVGVEGVVVEVEVSRLSGICFK